MDRRFLPANGRVAASRLRGQVTAENFVDGQRRQVAQGVLALWDDRAGTTRQRELLFGEIFILYEDDGKTAFGQAEKDGYVGYVETGGLRDPAEPTHFVSSRATHLYAAPDIRSEAMTGLSFGSRICVSGAKGRFLQTCDNRFVPAAHLRGADQRLNDPVTVAEMFIGTPYLWGGNSCWGIDCSGLVQAALLACGIDCPPDSDLQETLVGHGLDRGDPTRRGDMYFWKGHVGLAVDCETLIHANAHHMAVTCEPIADAISRIADAGGGPVTARKRL